MESYLYQPAHQLAALIREGKAKSVDIVQAHFQQIRQHNDHLHALVMIFEQEALAIAAERDREASTGQFRGPLHGVPITVKESFWLKGTKSTSNAKMFKDFTPQEDAIVVERIKESGAVILGKTNVPAFLLDYQVLGDLYPEGKNPYGEALTPGGSTGGGAAALAAGLTPLEIGSDFGGSVRVPSHFCGVYGLKPTERTVPMHGMLPQSGEPTTYIAHMVQAGPLARTMEDIELLWNIIKGPHKMDRDIARIDWQPSEKTALSDFRVAWVDQWPHYPTSSATQSMIQEFALKLSSLAPNSLSTSPTTLPDSIHDSSLRLYIGLAPYIIAQGTPFIIRWFMRAQFTSTILKGWKRHMKEFRRAFSMGVKHYGEMLLLRREVVKSWESFFQDYDVLICPTCYGPAYERKKIGVPFKVEDGSSMPYMQYVWPFVACFNATGHPALHVPLGLNEDGLPVGVQVVGKYWSEPDLIQFGRLMSTEVEGFVRPKGF